jgi:nicotinate-nucleotide adenylyltransferase
LASPIGLFGGSFDPVHLGHLRLATELLEAFKLERVVFLPTGQPWQRGRETYAKGEDRLEMLKLATAAEPRFSVDDRELKREGPTFTYDTLSAYRAEVGAEVPLVWLCGTDAFAKIETWHRWLELFDLAHFATAVRADDREWLSKGPGAVPRPLWPRITLNLKDLLAAPAGKIMTFSMTPFAISSTAMRSLVATGASIRYLTPDPVVDFIQSRSLYQTT